MDRKDQRASLPAPPAGKFRYQWLMLALALTIVGGISLWSLLQQRRLIEDNENERLQAQARIIDKNLGKQLEAANFALQGLINDIGFFRGAAGKNLANRRLKALSDAMSGIRTMFILDAKGTIVASNREELIGKDLSYRDYYKAPRAGHDPKRLYVSPPFKTVLGSYLINLSRVIPGSKGEFQGVVSAAIDPEFFNILLTSVLYAPDMRSGIIHRDGLRVLMAPELTDPGKDLSKTGSFFARHLASGKTENMLAGSSYASGEERLMALRTIDPAALNMDKPLIVSISRRTKAVYAGWRRNAAAQSALFAVFAAASLAALHLYQRRQRIFDRQSESAERALKESAERYQILLKSANDGIHILDGQGRLVEANQAFLTMLGHSEEQAAGLQVSDWDSQWSDEELLQVLARIIAAPATFETRHRRRDGAMIDVEISARGIAIGGEQYIYAASREITDRKKAEKELSDSRQQLMHIIDFLPDATFVIDLEGKVIAWNKAIEEMSGVKKSEMIGQGDYAYTVPFYGVRRPQLLNLLDMTDAELEKRYRHIERQGETLFAEVFVPSVYGGKGAHVWAIGAPLYDSHGARIGAIETIRDITERKRAELELQQAKEMAEASTRSKSQFLANMSHEIRTPMNAILGLTRLTLDTELTEKQRDYLFKVQSSSRALLGILNDILDYSKIEAGRLELEAIDFDLDGVLHALSDLFSYAAEEKGVEIFYEVLPGVPTRLNGDPLRLGQILNNLIGNAVKFTRQGEILVKAECLRNCADDIILCFSVRDTGIGIEPEQCELLFQAFNQVDSSISRKYGGTGLGLAISRHLVNLMGGEISMQSQPGKGSTFSFTVRLRNSASGQFLRDPASLRGMRALVVDDQETSRTILQQILQSWRFEVVNAASGEEAIGLIAQAASAQRPFELILLDWQMPGIDGLQVARSMREQGFGDSPAPPTVIMVSAYGKEQLLKSADGLHLDDILLKPVTASNLFDSVIGIQNQKTRLLPRAAVDLQAQINDRLAAVAGARLLLVEDNEINQLVALESLRKMGFVVDLAGNGRDSVQMAGSACYDAILMDLQMPEMDGFEATRLIRATAAGKTVPIIALTAAAMVEEKKACLDAGMNDHVAKPIDTAELADVLVRWIKPGKGATAGTPAGTAAGTPTGTATETATVERAADAADELPQSLPGFDLEAAVRRLHGNRSMLARLLQMFADQTETALRELEGRVAAGDFSNAAGQLHGLKGIAGNLGAVRLLAAAQKLERELASGSAASLADFQQQLSSAAAAIRASIVMPPTESAALTSLDPEQATGLLLRLRQLLESCTLVPSDLRQEFEATLHGHVPQPLLAAALRQLDLFQHDEALATLAEIERELGIDAGPLQASSSPSPLPAST